ncbi:hypothetical protein SteCoe_15149 [Stentor coeruleus]|uniref:DOMON domain-containing protein n=1 Tax=Stentor coeruleus TaxID=5963 RepID=A0A1R2C491_9CILI|nr:hypothetical protein SteCoe_15149 [Stentor coeruleus]
MKYVLLLCLFGVALSGRICLEKDWTLEWTFPDDQNINFKLILDQETLDLFGWVGIGFKFPDEGSGMDKADINNFILTDLPTDRYGDGDGLPEHDEDLGGDNNIHDPVWDAATLTYSWSRPVASGDIYDKEYIKDHEYKLLWAAGMMIGDTQMKHFSDDRAMEDIVLSDSFDEGCEEPGVLEV